MSSGFRVVLAFASITALACSRQESIDAASEDDAAAPPDVQGDAGPDAASDANLDANDFDANLDANDFDANDFDANDFVANDFDANDFDASDFDAGANDVGVDAYVPPDAFAAVDGGIDAHVPDAFVGIDAFDAPDAYAPPDAFVGIDAFDAPDAYAPPDAFVGVDAFDAPDAFVGPVFAPTLTLAAPMQRTVVAAATAFTGAIVAVGSDTGGSGAHGRLIYLGPARSAADSYFVDFTASTATTQLRAVADNTSVGTGTIGPLKRAIVARFDGAGITTLKTYTVLGRTTAFEDVASTGTELVAAGGLESSGLIAVIPTGPTLPASLRGFEVGVGVANVTFTSVAVSGSLVVAAGTVDASGALIAFDTAGPGSVRWMVTFPWTPRDMTFATDGSLLVVGDNGADGFRARFSAAGAWLESQVLSGTRLRSVLVTPSGQEWETGILGSGEMHVLQFTGLWNDRPFTTLPGSLGLTLTATGEVVTVGGMLGGPPMYSTTAFAPVSCRPSGSRPITLDPSAYPIPSAAGVRITLVTVGEVDAPSTARMGMMVAPGCP